MFNKAENYVMFFEDFSFLAAFIYEYKTICEGWSIWMCVPQVRVKLQVCLHVHIQIRLCLINWTCKQACKIIKFNIFNISVTLTGYQKIFKIQKIYQKRKAQESSSIYCLLYIKQRLLCTKFIYFFFYSKRFSPPCTFDSTPFCTTCRITQYAEIRT